MEDKAEMVGELKIDGHPSKCLKENKMVPPLKWVGPAKFPDFSHEVENTNVDCTVLLL